MKTIIRPETEMKESGASWMGKIPCEWSVSKLKWYLRRIDPRNPGDKQVLSLYREFGVIPKDSRDDNHNATSEDTSKYKYVRVGDFVVNKMKAWQGSVAVSEYDGIVSPAYYVYHFTDDSYHRRYFHYLLRSCYKEEFMRLSGGIRVGQWDLSSNDLDNVLVVIPKKEEQQAIADYLDETCFKIDEIIAEAKASIDEYKELKQSVIFEAVTKGLDKNVKMKDSGIEWIGEIPVDWVVKKFKYVATVNTNLVSPIGYEDYHQIAPDCIEKDSGRLIKERTVSEAGVESWNQLFKQGQLIYSKIRPTLNKVIIAPYDGLCSADMYPLDVHENIYFVQFAMLSKYFVGQVGLITQDRVKMPKINQDELSNVYVAVPERTEQQKIVDWLHEQLPRYDSLITEKESLINDLEAYKKSLIYEVVTGKRRVV